MSADYECDCIQEECESGAPAWVMTFADLMSLLLCFFVLLLSFSEMDVQKFKQIAGSMRMAFGVQREVNVNDIPMGTSIITQDFSPGKPEPTPVPEVRQTTTKEDVSLEGAKEKMEKAAESEAQKLRLKMQQEIEEGLIEVDSMEDKVVIRIKEKGSFPSGSAELHDAFLPVLDRIRAQIAETPGKITVAGHTDDVPINTFRFRSNWELSSSRAVSVLEQLLAGGGIKPEDTEVKGLADTQPMLPNDSAEHRAANRRVEIVITPSSEALVVDHSVGGDAAPTSEDDGQGPAEAEELPRSEEVPGVDNNTPSELIPEPQPEAIDEVIAPPAVPQLETSPALETPLGGGATPESETSVVVQDDGEQPALQPELTREIEDLFGNLETQQ